MRVSLSLTFHDEAEVDSRFDWLDAALAALSLTPEQTRKVYWVLAFAALHAAARREDALLDKRHEVLTEALRVMDSLGPSPRPLTVQRRRGRSGRPREPERAEALAALKDAGVRSRETREELLELVGVIERQAGRESEEP